MIVIGVRYWIISIPSKLGCDVTDSRGHTVVKWFILGLRGFLDTNLLLSATQNVHVESLYQCKPPTRTHV